MSKDSSAVNTPSHSITMLVDEHCHEPIFYKATIPIRQELADNEVLIRVKAASVNPLDYKLRTGGFEMGEIVFPLALGKDASGVVLKVGRLVKRLQVGDRVCGFLGKYKNGTYSKHVIFEEDELVTFPLEMNFKEAAAFPCVGRT